MSAQAEAKNNEVAVNEAPPSVTLSDVINSKMALEKLIALPLRAKIKFNIGRVTVAVSPLFEQFDKQKIELLDRYGERKPVDEIPGTFTWTFESPEKQAECDREFQELLATDANLNVKKISIDELAEDLDRIGDMTMTPGDFVALSWLVQE